MRQYSQMTFNKLYHKIIARLGDHRTHENVDKETIRKQVNLAAKELLTYTLPFRDYAYITTLAVSHDSALPQDFISPVRVLCSLSGSSPYVEARYVDPREFSKVTNWSQRQDWNKANSNQPIFTVWGQVDGTGQTNLVVKLGPNLDYITGSAPPGYTYPTGNVSGILEYYAQAADVVLDTDLIPVPYEYEDLVFLMALERMYVICSVKDKLLHLHQQVAEKKSSLYESLRSKEFTSERELDNFTEPVIPFVSPSPSEGEAQSFV